MPARIAILSLLCPLAVAIQAGLVTPARRTSQAAARVTVALTDPSAGTAVRIPAAITLHAAVNAALEVEITYVSFVPDGAPEETGC